jgi:hypothetical protein
VPYGFVPRRVVDPASVLCQTPRVEPAGVRVGVEFPEISCPMQWMFGTDCATADIAVGVAPYPAFFLFEVHAGFPIY